MPTTIPQFATAENIPVDRLRKLMRKHETLRDLCEEVGPTRVIPVDRIEEFRAAVRQAMGDRV